MRRPRPRTKPPEERRAELMDAAERLFLGRGVAPTTIDQITAAAGVAKGTFYLYFSDKDAVVAALGERFAQTMRARIEQAVAAQRPDDWPGMLAAWVAACTDGYIDAIRLHDVLFYGYRPPTRAGLVDNIVVDHLAGLLRGGAVAKAWKIDDARATALFIFSGHHGVVDDALLRERQIDRVRLRRRLERLCRRAVGLTRASL
jgi:AcrR family transcriptional regulator